MRLTQDGRKALNEFAAQMVTAAGVAIGEEFALEPRVLQTLHDKIVEDGSWFYQSGMVNLAMVPELKGEKLYMDLGGLVSSRTEITGNAERSPTDFSNLTNKFYELFFTESDIAIPYSKIDQWKFFKDFAQRYQRLHRAAIANDRLRVGWHGTSAAATTNSNTNPNGEDINKGWLQILREYDAALSTPMHVDSTGTTLGAGGDVPNLDKLVSDMKSDMIAKEFKSVPKVVLVSEDLIGVVEGKYYAAAGDSAEEKHHLDGGRILQTYGGLRAIVPPHFPDGTVMVTPANNLSIYTQEDSWRRTLTDKPSKNRWEDYNSRNEGYVVEQEGATALVEGITEYVAP